MAVVAAEGAGGVLRLGVGEVLQRVQADEGADGLPALSDLPLPVFLGDEGGAQGAHDPRIGGPDYFPAQVLLQGPEHCVILEGAPLDHDLIAQ